MRDVGQPKAKIAAERVMERVKGVNVVPHYCRIEDKDSSFFDQFQIIVLGLDSLEARSYINAVVCGFLGNVVYLFKFVSRIGMHLMCYRFIISKTL